MKLFKISLAFVTALMVMPTFADQNAVRAGDYPWPWPWAVTCSFDWQSLNGIWDLGNLNHGSLLNFDVVQDTHGDSFNIVVSRSDANGMHSKGKQKISRNASNAEFSMRPARPGIKPYTISVGVVYTSSIISCSPRSVVTVLMMNQPWNNNPDNGASWILQSNWGQY